MAYAAGHRNGCKNTHTLTPLFGIGVQAILLLALRCLFSFSTAVTKTGFAFLWRTGENEYRQKAFQSHTRKCGCRYPGGFQRRAGEACLWHTILLARSSVLYLLLRPNKAIRSCGRACAVNPLRWAFIRGRSWKRVRNAMQHELPAEQEVYKSSRLSSLVPPQRRFSKRCFQNASMFQICMLGVLSK